MPAGVEHLGDVGAVGRVVVIEDDPVGQHHRAGAPGDHQLVGDQAEHVEQLEAVVERRDVAAGDHHRLGRRQERGQLGAVAGHRRALGRVPQRGERGPHLLAPGDVVGVEVAELLDRDRVLAAQELGLEVSPRDRAGRVLGLLEADPVAALHVAEQGLAIAVGGGEGRVVGEHGRRPRVEPEVDRRHTQGRDQRAVIGLALLVAGAHDRHRAAQPALADDRADLGRRVLGAERDDRRRHQRARTFRVRPTASMICRSRS
jgi:hypothetical protein